MKTVAILGANGFVGSALCKAFSSSHNVIKVVRGDDILAAVKNADFIVHAANPGKRFRAENNPELDFEESVMKTFQIIEACSQKKIILISSISARTQLDKAYGLNRRACELLLDLNRNLVVRLGPMYSESKIDGALADILHNRQVYVSGDSAYAYVSVDYAAQRVVSLIQKKGIIEVGAKNGILLCDLAKQLGSTSSFTGSNDTQIPLAPPRNAPDASEVVTFAKRIGKTL